MRMVLLGCFPPVAADRNGASVAADRRRRTNRLASICKIKQDGIKTTTRFVVGYLRTPETARIDIKIPTEIAVRTHLEWGTISKAKNFGKIGAIHPTWILPLEAVIVLVPLDRTTPIPQLQVGGRKKEERVHRQVTTVLVVDSNAPLRLRYGRLAIAPSLFNKNKKYVK